VGPVITQFTMSLDGFVAGPDDDVGRLFRWYVAGDTDLAVHGGQRVFRMSRASADLLRESWGRMGAIVTGRRDFDVSKAWGGEPPFPVPTFIVTHEPPAEWSGPRSPFTFVTEGVEAAIAQARAAAGERVVAVSGTQIARQALRAGLLDEIHIDLAPVLLGRGVRLFDELGPVDLEQAQVVVGTGVTHLRYRVAKQARVSHAARMD
jgi:dihydrofolate reductase